MKAVNKAYGLLRKRVIEGVYPPGSRITEQEIAAASGVSRTPVREAMRRLEAKGLLKFLPHQGAFVAMWSEQDAEEIFELRAMLESYVVKLAAERATVEELAHLRGLAEQQYAEAQNRDAGFLERIADLNGQFHQHLQNCAGSERLKTMLSSLTDAPLVIQTFRDYSDEDLLRSAHHHIEIVQALESGDAIWASNVMRSHVMAARTVFRREHDSGSKVKVREVG